MLKDITLGQYFPGKSLLHRADPRGKLLFAIFYIVVLFFAKSAASFAFALLYTAVLIGISGLPGKTVLRAVRPLLFVILFTAVINIFWTTGETPLVEWKFIHIYAEGLIFALFMAVRIVCLIAGTSLLTYTTSPIALTDGIERLLGPLKAVHLPVHELAMMMTIALRFIPTLIEETDKIMSAQKARGADMETGGLMQRAKALIPILIPLFVSAFRRADELALAMVCRCYHGGEGRTRMRQLQLSFADFGGSVITVLVFAAVIMLNILL